MISGFVGSSPTSGSALGVQSLFGILFAPLVLARSLSLSLKIDKLQHIMNVDNKSVLIRVAKAGIG